MDPVMQMLIYAAITVITNVYGVIALSKKLDAKADKKDTHDRLAILEQAHGGIIT